MTAPALSTPFLVRSHFRPGKSIDIPAIPAVIFRHIVDDEGPVDPLACEPSPPLTAASADPEDRT